MGQEPMILLDRFLMDQTFDLVESGQSIDRFLLTGDNILGSVEFGL